MSITRGGGGEFILKKIRQLIIPATIIGGIYLMMYNKDLTLVIHDKFKGGYWFTFTLFELMTIQYIWDILIYKLHLRDNSKIYIVSSLCLAIILYIFSVPTISSKLNGIGFIIGLPMLRYYLYFSLGNIIRNHQESIIKWKYRSQLTFIIVLTFFVLFIIRQMPYNLNGMLFHLNLITLETSSLALVFMIFYKYQLYFSSQHFFAKILTFLGKRTLDIYLIHYFFLPKDLRLFGDYFTAHPAMILETLLSGIITFLIIGCCLVISELLRCNPTVSKYLLGTK